MPHETEAVSAQVLCTPYNHAPCHFMQSHIRKVYEGLAVTCYLHFWQNDWDLLRATAVTQGWNGYQNKSQHRKSTMEKKIHPCHSCRDSNLRPFSHESSALTTELSPPPDGLTGPQRNHYQMLTHTHIYIFSKLMEAKLTLFQPFGLKKHIFKTN